MLLQKKTCATLLVTVVLGVGAGYVANQHISRVNARTLPPLYQEGFEILQQVDPDYVTAVKKLEESLRLTREDSKYARYEGNIKMALARGIVNGTMHSGDDFESLIGDAGIILSEPIELLKDVAFNKEGKYKERVQSRALSLMGDFLINYCKQFYKNDQNIEDILLDDAIGGTANNQTLLAIASIYKYSADIGSTNSFYSTSNITSNYRVASIYLEELLTGDDLTEEEKQIFYQTARERTDIGEKLMTNIGSEEKLAPWFDDDVNESIYLRNRGNALRMQAVTLGKWYILEPEYSLKDSGEIERIFEESIVTLNTIETSSLDRLEMYTRYDYATWLAVVYGMEKKEKIKEILDPVIGKQNENAKVVAMLFKHEISDGIEHHKTHFHLSALLKLAEIDNRVEDWLKKVGWSETDLNMSSTFPSL